VLFDLDRAELKPGAIKALDWVAEQLLADPSLRLEIAGHCDTTGTEAHNQKLSERRANAARTYLVDKGVSGERLVARGYGFSSPIAPNDTPRTGPATAAWSSSRSSSNGPGRRSDAPHPCHPEAARDRKRPL